MDRYLQSVYLRNLTGINETSLPILEELGLLEDLDTLLALEAIVREYNEPKKDKPEDET